MRHVRGLSTPSVILSLVFMMLTGGSVPVAAAPEGQLTWAIPISLAPIWFDPAETPGTITPFMVLKGR